MIERSQPQPQTSLIRDAAYDKALSVDSAHRENQDNDAFFYANCRLGLFPKDPVDLHAFAKGQLIAMAILVPTAIALFYIFRLVTPSAGQLAMKLGNLL
jgi:hypothetical protein